MEIVLLRLWWTNSQFLEYFRLQLLDTHELLLLLYQILAQILNRFDLLLDHVFEFQLY